MSPLTERLQHIFRTVLELPPTASVEHLVPGSVPQWDSLGHATLVIAMESEFNVEIDILESLGITSFGSAHDLIAAKCT